MNDHQAARVSRTAGIFGLAFVVLLVIGFIAFVIGDAPAYDAPDGDWVAWYGDTGNRATLVIGAMADMLALLALIVFAALVSDMLRRVTPRAGVASVVLVSGAAAGVLLAAGFLIAASMAAALTFAPGFDAVPSAELLKAVEQAGIGVWILGGGWAAALFVAAVSFGALGTTLLAGWLRIAGFVVAALLLLSFFFLPFFLFPLWVLVVSIVLLRARSVEAT